MKKTLIMSIAIVSLATITACGQKKDVPEAVMFSFTRDFATAKNVKWDKKNDSAWEVEFTMSGVDYSAKFDNKGEWIEIEHEIKISDIPEMVKTTLDNDFSDYEIEEAEISETVKGKSYEFALNKDGLEMEVAIDGNGRVIKKEMKKDEDND